MEAMDDIEPRQVYCTYCGVGFGRDEHLERHILTHTKVKPYKCFTCYMSFSRKDLLQRHYTVHGRNLNNEEGLPDHGIIPKSAGRTPIACMNCAKTKTKCDKKFPCTRCELRNLECTVRPTRRQSKRIQRARSKASSTAESNSGSQNNTPSSDESRSNDQPTSQQPYNDETSPDSSQSHSRNTSLSHPTWSSPRVEQLPLSETPLFFDPLHKVPLSLAPSELSPLPTTMYGTNGFVSSTPVSGYDDFVQTTCDGPENQQSPQLFADPWSTVSVPADLDHLQIDPALMMSMNMDWNIGPNIDGMLGTFQGMNPPQVYGPLQTPIHTPDMDRTLTELSSASPAPIYFSPNTHNSIQDAGIPDLGAIVSAQEGWTVFRCTPSIASSCCPRTAKLNVERLEQSLRNHQGWSNWSPSWNQTDFAHDSHIVVAPLQEATRDKLLAITQTFLHKALDTHKDGNPSSNDQESSNSTLTRSNFILLPPVRVLDFFLKSYTCSFERYYSTSSRGVLDANELMMNHNDKASSLLILMMIAQGAMSVSSMEARLLTGGFTETCRISLFDLVEKNIIMASDPIVLRAALLFTVQAAWSGDKWQMDIAMGQRGMYCSMLRHAGILAPISTPLPLNSNGSVTRKILWQNWIQQESQSRLVYSWVIADQDLSLFHDTAPVFSVTELGACMPDSDQLWHARSATEWSETFDDVHKFSNGISSIGSGMRPLSLKNLFQHFLNDEIVLHGIQVIHLTSMHLRLLLHPLQTLVCQYSQLLSCFSGNSATSNSQTRALTAASTWARLQEVQELLSRWYNLAHRYLEATAMCPVMHANMIVFHLISMNAVTNFPEIEQLARREGEYAYQQQLSSVHKKCLFDAHEATMHAGQILRVIREMPRGIRPPWWAGAVYRAALVMWANAFTNGDAIRTNQQPADPSNPYSVPLDQLPLDHETIRRYVSRGEGFPTVTKRDGRSVPLDNTLNVLTHCIEVLDEGVATRFSDGIRNKLEKLAQV